MQLRYDVRKIIKNNYPVMNFGEAKGLTFERVIIYPTEKMFQWFLDDKTVLDPITKAKLYVALTRAKYNVAIVCPNDFTDLYKGKIGSIDSKTFK